MKPALVMSLFALSAAVAAQGGCCCNQEWWSHGNAFAKSGSSEGTFKMHYSLKYTRSRLDLFGDNGNGTRSYWSNVTTAYLMDYSTRTCTQFNNTKGWEQLCWDASNAKWHLDAVHGDYPNSHIDWRYLPTNSMWQTEHPSNGPRERPKSCDPLVTR
eukprot:Hpha_TRINITY_DN2135_c0_g1::TRINITY_DN2135_c0_g1_i1::g.42186::m.42186